MLQEHTHLLIALGAAVVVMAVGLLWCVRTSGGCRLLASEAAVGARCQTCSPAGCGISCHRPCPCS